MSIVSNVFPTVLKKAKVIPLRKSKELSDPNNFRPISILSLLSKPIERYDWPKGSIFRKKAFKMKKNPPYVLKTNQEISP